MNSSKNTDSNKKIVIIGAGVAGLSAGIYLQMNGYDTEIFEMAANPGGLCTAWKRKGYTFDGCIHWVTDSEPGGNLYHFWQEIGVSRDDLEYIKFDIVRVIEVEEGRQCRIYSDPDRLKEELLSFGPEDRELIEDLTETIRQYSKMRYDTSTAPELVPIFDKLKMLAKMGPFLKFIKKWDIPVKEYAQKYKNPFLKKVFLAFDAEMEYIPFLAVIFMIGCYAGGSGYPIGGSLEFAKKIEAKYLLLGGKVNYKSKVVKINVENNRATGIELENGSIISAGTVISAADGHYTIFELLGGRYLNSKIRSYYSGGLKPFPSIMQVSLGINDDFKARPHTLDFPLKGPITVDPKNTLKRLTMKFYNFDPALAPEGKTSAATFFTADYSYWAELHKNDRQKYESEKKRICDEIIDALDLKFPQIKQKVEASDVASPVTYVKHTGNWLGSFEGWIPDRKAMMTQISKQLPPLKNFYMIGQWVAPGGGLPSGAMTGRDITQIICKRDKKEFRLI